MNSSPSTSQREAKVEMIVIIITSRLKLVSETQKESLEVAAVDNRILGNLDI